MHGMRLVHEPHDDAVLGLRRDVETVGQALPFDDQRVIARHLERLWKPLEDALVEVRIVESFPCSGSGARMTLPP